MREDLLHFIWKHKKLQQKELLSADNEKVVIVDYGMHNHHQGPDFFNAKINIDSQLWAGNVEIHINASDWYVHHHEKDENYDNVILHVVWEDDGAIYRKDNSKITTLVLSNYISKEMLETYKKLFDKEGVAFINCEKDIAAVDEFLFDNWLERLYFERLEQKSQLILDVLNKNKNDWEKTLFCLLLKNFGLNINGDSFLSLAEALDFSIVRKLQTEAFKLESVFYGMMGFLQSDDVMDTYFINLKKEYHFLKNKHSIKSEGVIKPNFFKLRPSNFPTIRLSQLANLYGRNQHIFNALITASTVEEIYQLFQVSASDYWSSHYVFGKESGKRTKKITTKFIDLLIVNTILPLKFCYANYLGKDVSEDLVKIIIGLKVEENSKVDNFLKLKVDVKNAMESQAVLQLYKNYCVKNKCLQCAVGGSLLNRID